MRNFTYLVFSLEYDVWVEGYFSFWRIIDHQEKKSIIKGYMEKKAVLIKCVFFYKVEI